MIKQWIGYQAFLVSAAFIIFATGQLHGSAVSAAGINDMEIDFNDMVEMSEAWLLEADVNEPNEPVVGDVNITSDGGHFELSGGLVIDAPAGAVSEAASFQIRLLDESEVEPYLDIGQVKKGFLGGLEIISDGTVFNEPVLIRFPVKPLEDPNSLAYIFYLNKENGTLIPDLPEEPDESAPSSLKVPAEASFGGTYMYDSRDLIVEMLTQDLPYELHYLVLTEVFDALGHNDCEENPCRCLGQIPIEGAVDYESSEGCSKVAVSGAVLFPYCEGQPVQSYSFKEQSLQIAVKTDKNSILCDGPATMTVNIFDMNDQLVEDYEVKVTTSRPDLLEVIPSEGDAYRLERVGNETGVANVVIDAGCGITRTVPIQVGCEIPDLTGRWVVSGSETWWGCQDPEEDGVYTEQFTVEFDSQVEINSYTSRFGGSFEYSEFTEEYTLYYTESYTGSITVDCEVTDHCTYKVSGSTDYTERYYFPDSEPGDPPYIISGIDTFSGRYSGGVITLTTLGFDTEGDTCQTSGSVTLRR